MLQELSVVEQRYLAVREVLDGAKVTDVATRYGVDRRTVHRWLVRYASEGLGALADRSSRPDRCPHQIPPEVEARIVALRTAHPGWGPRTIVARLRRELEAPPSRSSIYRCLVRHRLIEHKPRRRRRQDYQAVGAITSDGAVAARRDGQDLTARRTGRFGGCWSGCCGRPVASRPPMRFGLARG